MSEFLPALTPRQLEILRLSAEGVSVVEMSRTLGIDHATTKTHIRRLLARWRARNRAHAVAMGFRAGVLW